MSRLCGCKIIKTTQILPATATTITMVVIPKVLTNKHTYLLDFCDIPFSNVIPFTNPAVIVSNNNVNIPVVDEAGNPVTAADIGCCRAWVVTFGNMPLTGTVSTPRLVVRRGIKNTFQCGFDGYTPAPTVVG